MITKVDFFRLENVLKHVFFLDSRTIILIAKISRTIKLMKEISVSQLFRIDLKM